MNFFRTNEVVLKLLQMDTGDVFSTAKLRKGFDDLTQLLRNFRLHRFRQRCRTSNPFPNSDKIDLTLELRRRHKFFVRRIDFSGNTTTRDKVIRRATAAGRGRCLQQASVGTQHSAPEPAWLFRGSEGGRGGQHQQGQQERHGGHHAQGAGAQQELHSIAGRRFGSGGKLRGALLTPPTTSLAWAKAWASADRSAR